MEVPQSSDSEQESGDEHLNLVLRMRFVIKCYILFSFLMMIFNPKN